MFGFMSGMRALFGALKVEQIVPDNGGYPIIRISGFDSQKLENDLQKLFKTRKVWSNVFDKVDRYTLVFPAFFAIEVEKMLQTIIESPERLNVPRRTAKTILEALYEYTWLSGTKKVDYVHRLNQDRIQAFKYKPLPFQQPYIDMFDRVTYQYSLNGVLLDAVMGSGKTMTSLYISESANKDKKIVVTPANALDTVWVKTIRDDILRPITIWTTKSTTPYNNEEYIVIHYDALRKATDLIKKLPKQSYSMIIDECHNFADYTTAQSKNLVELQRVIKSDVVIPQSGTTFKALGSEIITMMLLLDNSFNEDIAKRFSRMYGTSAVESLQLLQHRMGLLTYRVTKEQVGLPEPIIKNFKVTSPLGKQYTLAVIKQEMESFVKERVAYYKSQERFTDSQYWECLRTYEQTIRSKSEEAAFDKYKNDVKVIRSRGGRDCSEEIQASNAFENKYIIPTLKPDQKATFKEVKTIYKYVALKINGECLGRVLGKRRKECAVEIAKNIPYKTLIESAAKKTLVFTVYVDTLKTIRDTVEKQGYRSMAVFGETNKDLNNIIRTFDTDKTYNPLVATFKSLSTAVPMTMADVMIMVDTPFRDYVFQQTVARINRLGTTTQTYVYIAELDTGSEQNMSQRTTEILRWSQTQIEKITGVKSPFEITEDEMALEAMSSNTIAMEYYQYDTHLENKYIERLQ